MPRNAPSRQGRGHRAERQRAQERHRQEALARAARRRRAIGIGVVVGVLLATVAVVFAAGTSKRTEGATSTTTTSTTAVDPSAAASRSTAPAITPTVPPPGAALTDAVSCPPTDGSAERTTSFASPPPMCIDPAKDYRATIHTTKGDITVLLDPERAPNTVNNFVVLARYHYYDGVPVTRIVPRGWYEFGTPAPSPGYTIPSEAPPGGSIPTALMLATVAGRDGANSGAFLVGSGDQVAALPTAATIFGTVLDMRVAPGDPGDQRTVSAEIDRTGTRTGEPTELVQITGIDVVTEDRRS